MEPYEIKIHGKPVEAVYEPAHRDFGTCPFFLEAREVSTGHIVNGRPETKKVCDRKPISMFNDPLCKTCPLMIGCCDFYRGMSDGRYHFCPIDGTKL